MMQTPYYIHYSPPRMMVHKMVTSKYFDLAISAVIGLNVITMAMEIYMMPRVSLHKIQNYLRYKVLIEKRNKEFPLFESQTFFF